MPAIMQSIHPKWCQLITIGEKTIELRKTRPKIDPPFKVYMYCTKAIYKGKYLHTSDKHGILHFWHNPNDTTITVQPENYEYTAYTCSGKVIGEYICDRIDKYPCYYLVGNKEWIEYLEDDEVLEKMQLSYDDFKNYLNGSVGYGYHISDLVIYDKPKELGEFKAPCLKIQTCENCRYSVNDDLPFGEISIGCDRKIHRPPQSWCYVEELR